MLCTSQKGCLAAVIAAGTLASSALADAPPMALTIIANSVSSDHSLAPSSVASGVGLYEGAFGATGWSASCNYNAFSQVNTVGGTVTGAEAWQNGSFSFSNLSAGDIIFTVTLSLPTNVTVPMTGSFSGQVSGTLVTNTGGGRIRAIAPTALWTSYTGGDMVRALFTSPFEILRTTAGSTSLGTRSFGLSTPVATPTFGNSIAMTFNFLLTSGDTVNFNTALNGTGSVPAPGALGLLACAGLATRRRRR